MLEMTVIPDSAVADIFASKCCGGGLPDQNLEIRIANRGEAAVALQSRFRLEGTGGRRIAPGEVAALYADMDPALLARFQVIVLFDDGGKTHRFPLAGGAEIPAVPEKGA